MTSPRSSVDWIRFGTSSFSSRDWVGPFYPEGLPAAEFLRHYSAVFDTVEVDATYYAIPSARTVDGWVERTPDHFLISAKFPRSICHGGEGAGPDGGVVLDPEKTYRERDRFLSVMERLGARRGPLLLQFPYFSKAVFSGPGPFMERLDRFLEGLPEDVRYAVEVRNRAWLSETLVSICRRHQVALAMVDHAWMPMPDELPRGLEPHTTDYAYIRLLGDRKEIEAITKTWDREVIDRTDRLDRWAEFLVGQVERNITTLVYINNHYAGHAPATAQRLADKYRDRLRSTS